MKKIMKSDRIIPITIFCLCGAILLLMASVFLSYFQSRGMVEKISLANNKINIISGKLDSSDSKYENLEVELDLMTIYKDLALEDVSTLRTGFDVMIRPYIYGMSDLLAEYDDMLIDLFNDTYPRMSDFIYSYYDVQIDLLRDRSSDLEKSSMKSFSKFTEENTFNY